MKKTILLIIVIAGVIVAASVLIALLFIYPEKTVEIPISGTLSPDRAEYQILGYLKHNSAVGLNLDTDGDCEAISIELIDIDDNDSVAGTSIYPESVHVEKSWLVAGLFRGDYYMLKMEPDKYYLEMEPEGFGDFPLSYNGMIYITQRGVWWW